MGEVITNLQEQLGVVEYRSQELDLSGTHLTPLMKFLPSFDGMNKLEEMVMEDEESDCVGEWCVNIYVC